MKLKASRRDNQNNYIFSLGEFNGWSTFHIYSSVCKRKSYI